jgi:bifunctional UDP-N-acetylglucosamine pyrophosphorylase/glucosamine-1-phosphate N-acetyltransferase
MQLYPIRLNPNDDLKQGLLAAARSHHLQAGFVVTGMGSLQQACIRFAHQPEPVTLADYFEIVMLSGLVSRHGLHLHMAIADRTGRMLGGHVCSGCQIYTTAEVVLGNSPHHEFLRSPDVQTGFNELEIRQIMPD